MRAARDYTAETPRTGPRTETPRGHRVLVRTIAAGPSAAGKSCLVLRAARGTPFAELRDATRSTVGAEMESVLVDGVLFQVWDTCGQERFRSIAKGYYRGAGVMLFVFDLTQRDSFLALDAFVDEALLVNDTAALASAAVAFVPNGGRAMGYIIGNKRDLVAAQGRAVTEAEAQAKAAKYGMRYTELSATDNSALQLFQSMAKRINDELERDATLVDRVQVLNRNAATTTTTTIVVPSGAADRTKNTCCN